MTYKIIDYITVEENISRAAYPVNHVQRYEVRQLKKAKRGEGNK